jgi:hypothetical protein
MEMVEDMTKLEHKLPADIKTKWLTALRDGSYKKGRSYLNRNGGFCCLGVLYDVMGGTWQQIKIGDDMKTATVAENPYYLYRATPDRATEVVLPELRPVLLQEIKDDDGDQMPVESHLARMNDRNNSFDLIADWIEKNL